MSVMVRPDREEVEPEKVTWFQKAKNLWHNITKSEERALAESLGQKFAAMPDYDLQKLLDKFESDDTLRTTTETIIDACTAQGWELVPPKNGEVNETVKQWIEDNILEWIMFMRNLVINLDIYDEVYVEVAGTPVFKVIEPWVMQPIEMDAMGHVKQWGQKVAGSEQVIPFEPDDIVHAVLTPIGTRLHGSPRILTLKTALETKKEAELYNYGVFKRKGTPAKAFILKQGSKQDYNRIKKKLKDAKPGENLLIRGDMDVKDLSGLQKDLQYGEVINKIEGKIMGVQHVPPIMAAQTRSANLESNRNEINVFVLRVKAIQMVGSAIITKLLKLRFDGFNNKFRMIPWVNEEQEVRMHAIAVNSGQWTIDESREKQGLPEIPEELDPMHLAKTPKPFWAGPSQGQSPGGGRGGGAGERQRGGSEREPGEMGASVSAQPPMMKSKKIDKGRMFGSPTFDDHVLDCLQVWERMGFTEEGLVELQQKGLYVDVLTEQNDYFEMFALNCAVKGVELPHIKLNENWFMDDAQKMIVESHLSLYRELTGSAATKSEETELIEKPGWEQTEHELRYRLRNPSECAGNYGRKEITHGVSILGCKLKTTGKWAVQSLRFSKKVFTLAQAKAWFAAHKDSFKKSSLLELEIQFRQLSLLKQKQRILEKIEKSVAGEMSR